MSEIVPARQATPTIPDTEFATIFRQAEVLAESNIVPRAYQRNPANIVVAAITGRTFNWDPIAAMRNLHIIEGTASIRPEAMLGLVRQAGHTVTGELTEDAATVTGVRADDGSTLSYTFTMADAKTAGLAGKDNWKKWPKSMLWARAVAQLCRMHFSDVLAGVSYCPEELGATVDESGSVVDVESVEVAPLEQDGIRHGEVVADPVVDVAGQNRVDLVDDLMDIDGPIRDVFWHKIRAKGWDTVDDIPADQLGRAIATVETLRRDGMITGPQLKRLGARGTVLGFDKDTIADFVSDLTGGRTTTRTELLKSEAGTLIDTWEALTPPEDSAGD